MLDKAASTSVTARPAARAESRRRGFGAFAGVLLAILLGAGSGSVGPVMPPDLAATGLYADSERLEIDPGHLAFAPQYALWTDGAAKRRWMALPSGTAIDGSDPDVWDFPVGTRFWKEFAFDGRPVETRYIERLADGSWGYATYVWSEDGTEALLAPMRGMANVLPLGEGAAHAVPGISDCRVCHEAGPNRILGFGALQLSPDRDPGALHREEPEGGIDLAHLIENEILVNYPERLPPPRIAAATPEERAALGYVHGNCGHCHDRTGKLGTIGLSLRHESAAPVAPARATTIGRRLRKAARGQSPEAVLRIESGHPDRSALLERMASRSPALQMPPLGTALVDQEAVALIRRWIAELEDPPTTTIGGS
jgi:hypothetical protein